MQTPLSTTVDAILTRSGLTKTELCRTSGVSRSQLDDYLAGRSQPSVRQLERLAEVAGCGIEVRLVPEVRQVPPDFVAVLEFGELFPRRDPRPPLNAGPIWREIATRG